jgi:hypothetical protein
MSRKALIYWGLNIALLLFFLYLCFYAYGWEGVLFALLPGIFIVIISRY